MALFSGDKAGVTPGKEERIVSATRAGELHTLLGKGSEFEGKLTFEGQVRIDGKFQGQISTKDIIIIGESAKVMADINAGTVVVNGTVEGTIRATQMVELHPPARVKGVIESPATSMEKGAIFEGSMKMENLSGKLSAAPPPPPGTSAK